MDATERGFDPLIHIRNEGQGFPGAAQACSDSQHVEYTEAVGDTRMDRHQNWKLVRHTVFLRSLDA